MMREMSPRWKKRKKSLTKIEIVLDCQVLSFLCVLSFRLGSLSRDAGDVTSPKKEEKILDDCQGRWMFLSLKNKIHRLHGLAFSVMSSPAVWTYITVGNSRLSQAGMVLCPSTLT